MKKIKVGIAGAAGYTGGELLRLLIQHPNVEISWALSRSSAGKPVSEVFPDLYGETDLYFNAEPDYNCDLLFMCMGHGEARNFLETYPGFSEHAIIDLSRDFRPKENSENFVYGLPECKRELIRRSKRIANPGCFATAIQLGLLPLADEGALPSIIHTHALTGSSGAGRALSETTHFSNRHSNASVYNVFEHPHLQEIQDTLQYLTGSESPEILFVPQRASFSRGIMACTSMKTDLDPKTVESLFVNYYSKHPFTHYSKTEFTLKNTINTNKCLINIKQKGNALMIVSYIDNLMKGASGQAVQNMNLMFGFEETCGLKTKTLAY